MTVVHNNYSSSLSYDLERRERLALLSVRLETIEKRTSARAAANLLFADNASDWRTLPARIGQLCQILEQWDAKPGDAELPCSFLHNKSDDAMSSSSTTDSSFFESRRMALTSAVFAAAPPSFFHNMTVLFQWWMKRSMVRNNENDSDDNDNEDENDCDYDSLAIHLRKLGWLKNERTGGEGLVRTCLKTAIYETIHSHVQATIQGEYTTGEFYPELLEWKETLVKWVQTVLQEEEQQQHESENWSDRLELCVAECYCRVRMAEIFDLVADYPDSHPAAVELQQILHITQMHLQLAQQLQVQLSKRLNHPGANTSQIIDVYIAVIKVLGVLDPTSSAATALSTSSLSLSTNSTSNLSSLPLLSVVAEPVRGYLRGRSDTVRCIITSLTDAEVGGDLYNELRRQDAKPLENVVVDSDDEEECPDMNWQPKPPVFTTGASWLSHHHHHLHGNGLLVGAAKGAVTSAPHQPPQPRRAADSDILAMLVSIYGSKELFVDEYRIMLADKLLASLDYNTDNAVHTLELLKLRFGEASMRNCEVMIKDMDDSKRTNANIHSSTLLRSSSTGSSSVVDVAMISHIFWPPLQQETLKRHPRLQAQLDAFAAEYARLKNPRKLAWMEQLGTVQLELDVMEGDKIVTKEFNCTPLLATLISHFEDKTEWTLEDLSNETGVPEHVLQKKMAYWINQRVVVQKTGSSNTTTSGSGSTMAFELASPDHVNDAANRPRDALGASTGAGGDGSSSHHVAVLYEEDDGLASVSVSAQEKAEMDVYESYIVGMLTNSQGGLQLLRIHGMLQMFVTGSDTKYNKTPAQLSAFLQLLCQQEKLECGPDGMYKLYKHH